MKFTFVTRILMITLVLATAVLCSSASLVAQQACPYFRVLPDSFDFPSGGGSGSSFVYNAEGCADWTATSHASFITVTNTNQFNGTLSLAVAQNFDGTSRNGTITIDIGSTTLATISISQQGIPTVPLYRYWNATIYNHFYTTNFGELGYGANGYVFEKVEGHVFNSPVGGTVPLKRYYCAENGDHFYTTNPNEPGAGLPCYQFERVEAYVYPNQVSGTVPLYRYYEPNNYDHFYTTNYNELRSGNLGWYLEGVQCFVFP